MNECTITGNFIKKLESLGISESIIRKYKEKHGIAPTCQRELSPIDKLFILARLEIETGGYFPFKHIQSDHRVLWAKINCKSIFGHKI